MSKLTKEISKSLIDNNKNWRDVSCWLGVTPQAVSYKKNKDAFSFEEVRIIAHKLKWTDTQKTNVF